jgi:hypothetical protein
MINSSTSATQFAVCVDNEGYPASLEVGKIYRVLPDEDAAAHGYIRVVDESGEDYGYSARRFYPIELPMRLEEILLSMPAVATAVA